MPFDNLSLDKNGDIWGAGFPSVTAFLASVADPWNVDWPTTVWRFRKDKGYKAEKVIEDREAKVVAGGATVRYDSKTGRLFMGGKSALIKLLQERDDGLMTMSRPRLPVRCCLRSEIEDTSVSRERLCSALLDRLMISWS